MNGLLWLSDSHIVGILLTGYKSRSIIRTDRVPELDRLTGGITGELGSIGV